MLQDYRHLEDALGARLQWPRVLWMRLVPERSRDWLYRFALERGYLDTILTACVVTPFVRLFRWFDRIERRWAEYLAVGRPRGLPPVSMTTERVTETAKTYR